MSPRGPVTRGLRAPRKGGAEGHATESRGMGLRRPLRGLRRMGALGLEQRLQEETLIQPPRGSLELSVVVSPRQLFREIDELLRTPATEDGGQVRIGLIADPGEA